MKKDNLHTLALQFILLMGLVSMFGDVAYEGGRGVAGPFLATLGASAVAVGTVAGLGEFLGYGIRLISGTLADRTRAYWLFAALGYGMIAAVPLLALAGRWEVAAALLILERIGKGLRSPAKDTLLSFATKQVGRGWGFGIHEAIDQIGGILGPLVFVVALQVGGSYRGGFTFLWLPTLLCLAMLLLARRRLPAPLRLEQQAMKQAEQAAETRPAPKRTPEGYARPALASAAPQEHRLPGTFWLYSLFVLLSVAGFANFQLISYHLQAGNLAPGADIALLYAIAMLVDAVVALVIGRAYDRIGLRALLAIPLLTMPIPWLAFTSRYALAIVAVVLWGAVMGIHETIMRAAIADITPIGRRGQSYGIFNTLYGTAWLLAGAGMGWLYERTPLAIGVVAVLLELASVPVLLRLLRQIRPASDTGLA